MEDLIKKIEQWANDRNIIKGSKPIDQAMKLFSEFGELADNVGKGRDIKDDCGDVFVVLTVMAKQIGLDINKALDFSGVSNASLKHAVLGLNFCLYDFSVEQDQLSLLSAIESLESVCIESNNDMQECVQLAYDDIKERKGILINGVFIKESDPTYAQVIAEIENNHV